MDLTRKRQVGAAANEVERTRQLLLSLRSFFETGLQQVESSSVGHISTQGILLVDCFLAEVWDANSPERPEDEKQILAHLSNKVRDIAKRLQVTQHHSLFSAATNASPLNPPSSYEFFAADGNPHALGLPFLASESFQIDGVSTPISLAG